MKLHTRLLITAMLPLCLPLAVLSPVRAQTPPTTSTPDDQMPKFTPEMEKLLLAAGKAVETFRWDEALQACDKALMLASTLHDSLSEAALLAFKGQVYDRTGQPQKALEFYHKAAPLFHAVGNKEGEAVTLSNIGQIYADIGQPQKALEFYYKSLPLRRAVGDKNGVAVTLNNIVEAVTLNNIGSAYDDMGQPQKALESYNQALPLFRSVKHTRGEATTLNNIGKVYNRTGQPQKALEFYNQSLLLRRATGDKRGEATTLNSIGLVYARTGQPQKALESYNQALSLSHTVGDKQGEATILTNIGTFYRQQQQITQAIRVLEEAVALTETIRENLGGLSEAKVAYLESELKVYYAYADMLLEQHSETDAFALVQKIKARALLDLLGGGRVALHKALTHEEQEQEQTLRRACDTLNKQMIGEGARNEVGSKQRFASLQEELRQAERDLSKYTDTLYALHPDLARQRVAHTLTAVETGRILPSDTALLEYAVLRAGKDKNKVDRVVAFVVTPDGKATAHTLPIHADELNKQCVVFREACADPRKPFLPLSRQLYDVLIAPLALRLVGKTHLLICPDGPLWDVPFAALVGGERKKEKGESGHHLSTLNPQPSTFLADRFLLTYAYSATGAQATLLARPSGTALSDVFALANPDFGDAQRFGDSVVIPGQRPFPAPSRPFPAPSRPFAAPSRDLFTQMRGGIAALPGTQREADMLHNLYPSAAIFTGATAQESTFKAQAGKYKYLHLASHAFFNDAAPLLSSVFLAAPPKTGAGSEEDGFLTARELLDMDLHADMVVLSACQTARGEKHSGEGIVGMTWALFVAGCPTQVLSQWSVDDAATALLMTRFYRELKGGQAKGVALQTASRELRRNSKYAHPYYWAPFQLVGQWR